MAEVPYALLVAGTVVVGLLVSNYVYDRGVPNYVSRKIGHGAGGLAFLMSFMFLSSVWAMILAGAFGAVLYLARVIRPSTFRGVGGTGRSRNVMAEIWFALVAVPVVFISWYWLGRADIAIASLLFMAWGDGITGLVRARVYHRPVKGWWGSLAMLVVCVALALAFIRPFWIGAFAAGVAVVVEYLYGDNGSIKWADDNLAVPLAGMGVMLLLMLFTGNLVLEGI